ncbi:MAG: hypothetical protein N3D10_02060 [Candidatus Micrarchaeota archaeon]|nr:hypothetical protein [Candidatus Micrarchaeota archaeon]
MKKEKIQQLSTAEEYIKNLEKKINSIEERLDNLDKKLSLLSSNSNLVSDPRQGTRGYSGVWVSSSNAPTSFIVQSNIFLSPVDEQIIKTIRERGAVCAEDIKNILGYRRQNAASARLARLASLNILKKHQAGRRVYYSFD